MTRPDLEQQLRNELASALAMAFETMAGQKPEVAWSVPGPPGPGGLYWNQPFPPLGGALWAHISERDWKAAGTHLLAGAGIDGASEDELKSTFLEVLGQAMSAVARALTAAGEREVTPAGGAEEQPPALVDGWAGLELDLPDGAATLRLAFGEGLLEPLLAAAGNAAENNAASDLAFAAAAAGGGPVDPETASVMGSRTFGLLLDVELPVSISFGRADVPLKEVLKLTTGSIIELDRAVNEPVEVIVNNRVIARGEVVVVDGNFGVRIQKVASRHERLRTLE